MTVININHAPSTPDMSNVRHEIVEWARDHDIEIETLNELLANLGIEAHAEFVEVQVTINATLKVRLDNGMDPTDVLETGTYDSLQYEVNVWSGDVDGVVEVETEDINITVDEVEAIDG